MKKAIITIILTLWQLPQCIVGWIMELILKANVKEKHGALCFIYSNNMRGGISLGRVIILAKHYYQDGDEKTEYHEFGHARQSTMLGPIYLLVVGLPSLIWAWIYNGPADGYYSGFYTERWADKLGGVNRQ